MLLVLMGVRMLMNEVKPNVVIMTTFETDLPVSAMAKYMRISNHMGICGYTQTEYRRDGTDQRDHWLFTK